MLYDVLVVGSGISGLRAAIEAARFGLKVGVMVKGNPLRSNSAMASGGINAALATVEEGDTAQKHFHDTLKGGAGLCNKAAVDTLTHRAAEAIEDLVEMGVEFDRLDNGNIAQRSFGGAGKKRTCYVQDKTGAAITQGMFMYARQLDIEWIKDHQLLDFLHHDGKISGLAALKKSDSSVSVFVCKSLIIASGGYAGIYKGFTTNPQEVTGDALAAAMRAGLRLCDMEFVQFHPTGLAKSGALMSEAARGEGGHLVNSDGVRFVNELDTRDVVALAIAEEINSGKDVYLDIRHLGEEVINSKLPTLRKACISSEGVDPINELVPIKPVAHYTMGGIECQADTSTALEGLFVCGEAAGMGIHGANRLGGNSLLEGVVFGKLAAEKAVDYAKNKPYKPIDYEMVIKNMNLIDHIMQEENRFNINSIRTTLGKTLFQKVGIYRSEESLQDAFDYTKYLRRLVMGLHCVNKEKAYNMELCAILEIRNALLLAETLVGSALARQESRGAHKRTDFPERDDREYRMHTYARELKNGYIKIEFEADSGFRKYFGLLKQFLTN